MDKKKIILTVVSLLAFIVAGIFLMQRYKQQAVQPQNQTWQQSSIDEQQNEEIDTSDWKTHVSEGWGYSIKYPSNLYIKVTPQGDKFPGDTLGDDLMPKGEIFQDGGQTLIISDIEKMGVQDIMPNEKIHISVLTIRNKGNKSLELYVKERTNDWTNIINVSNIKIEKIEARKIIQEYSETSRMLHYFIKNNDWIYELHAGLYGEDEMKQENFKLVEKIFSTFEFRK